MPQCLRTASCVTRIIACFVLITNTSLESGIVKRSQLTTFSYEPFFVTIHPRSRIQLTICCDNNIFYSLLYSFYNIPYPYAYVKSRDYNFYRHACVCMARIDGKEVAVFCGFEGVCDPCLFVVVVIRVCVCVCVCVCGNVYCSYAISTKKNPAALLQRGCCCFDKKRLGQLAPS